MIRSLDDHRTVATPPLAEETPHSRYAWRCIHNAAAGISHQHGFSRTDRADLAQELAIGLCQGWGRFDPARGEVLGFISTIVRRKSASLVRERYSRKKGWHLRQHPLPAEESRDGEQWPGFNEHEAFCTEKDLTYATIDLRLDIAEVMKKLPPPLRYLAEQLQTYSVQEIACEQDVPRGRIYSRLKSLRRFFRKLN